MKVRQTDIDVVNRWKSLEAADGNRPNRPMQQHYYAKKAYATTLLCRIGVVGRTVPSLYMGDVKYGSHELRTVSVNGSAAKQVLGLRWRNGIYHFLCFYVVVKRNFWLIAVYYYTMMSLGGVIFSCYPILLRPVRRQPTRAPAYQVRFLWRPSQYMAINMSTVLNALL
jgi:hypothetical protein